jgi:hypothetical protein
MIRPQRARALFLVALRIVSLEASLVCACTQVTVEGDNYLLPQQTARFLLKALAGLRQSLPAGKYGALSDAEAAAATEALASLPPAVAHLGVFLLAVAPNQCEAATAAELGQPAALQAAFDHRAGRLAVELEQKLAALEASGVSAHQGAKCGKRERWGGGGVRAMLL